MPNLIFGILFLILLFCECNSREYKIKIDNDWKNKDNEMPYSYLKDLKDKAPFNCTLRHFENKNEIIEGKYVKDSCEFNMDEEIIEIAKLMKNKKLVLYIQLEKNPFFKKAKDEKKIDIEIIQVIFRDHNDIKEGKEGPTVSIMLTELKEIKSEPIVNDLTIEENLKKELKYTEDEIKQVEERIKIIIRNLDECYYQRVYLIIKEIEKGKNLIEELKIRVEEILNKDNPEAIKLLAEEAERERSLANKERNVNEQTEGRKTQKQTNKKSGKRGRPRKKRSSEEEEEDKDDEDGEEEDENEDEGEEDDDPTIKVVRRSSRQRQVRTFYNSEEDEDNDDEDDEDSDYYLTDKGKGIAEETAMNEEYDTEREEEEIQKAKFASLNDLNQIEVTGNTSNIPEQLTHEQYENIYQNYPNINQIPSPTPPEKENIEENVIKQNQGQKNLLEQNSFNFRTEQQNSSQTNENQNLNLSENDFSFPIYSQTGQQTSISGEVPSEGQSPTQIENFFDNSTRIPERPRSPRTNSSNNSSDSQQPKTDQFKIRLIAENMEKNQKSGKTLNEILEYLKEKQTTSQQENLEIQPLQQEHAEEIQLQEEIGTNVVEGEIDNDKNKETREKEASNDQNNEKIKTQNEEAKKSLKQKDPVEIRSNKDKKRKREEKEKTDKKEKKRKESSTKQSKSSKNVEKSNKKEVKIKQEPEENLKNKSLNKKQINKLKLLEKEKDRNTKKRKNTDKPSCSSKHQSSGKNKSCKEKRKESDKEKLLIPKQEVLEEAKKNKKSKEDNRKGKEKEKEKAKAKEKEKGKKEKMKKKKSDKLKDKALKIKKPDVFKRKINDKRKINEQEQNYMPTHVFQDLLMRAFTAGTMMKNMPFLQNRNVVEPNLSAGSSVYVKGRKHSSGQKNSRDTYTIGESIPLGSSSRSNKDKKREKSKKKKEGKIIKQTKVVEIVNLSSSESSDFNDSNSHKSESEAEINNGSNSESSSSKNSENDNSQSSGNGEESSRTTTESDASKTTEEDSDNNTDNTSDEMGSEESESSRVNSHDSESSNSTSEQSNSSSSSSSGGSQYSTSSTNSEDSNSPPPRKKSKENKRGKGIVIKEEFPEGIKRRKRSIDQIQNLGQNLIDLTNEDDLNDENVETEHVKPKQIEEVMDKMKEINLASENNQRHVNDANTSKNTTLGHRRKSINPKHVEYPPVNEVLPLPILIPYVDNTVPNLENQNVTKSAESDINNVNEVSERNKGGYDLRENPIKTFKNFEELYGINKTRKQRVNKPKIKYNFPLHRSLILNLKEKGIEYKVGPVLNENQNEQNNSQLSINQPENLNQTEPLINENIPIVGHSPTEVEITGSSTGSTPGEQIKRLDMPDLNAEPEDNPQNSS